MSIKSLFITACLLTVSLYVEASSSSSFSKEPSSNQIQVIRQLDSVTDPGKRMKIVLQEYETLKASHNELRFLSRLNGEQYTTMFNTMEIVNREYIRHLFDPLRPLIANPCAYQDEVYDLCCWDGIEIWGSVSVNRGFLNGNQNASGYKMSGYDITVGAQKRLTSTWLLGGSFCYSMQHVNYNIGGSSKDQSAIGAVYTLYRPSSFYFLADLLFGASENDMHRRIKINERYAIPHSRPKISDVSFYSEIGKDFCWDCFLFQPFVGIEAEHFRRNCFKEKEAAPLNLLVSRKDLTSAFSRVGLHIAALDYAFDVNFAFDIAWQYRLTSPNTDLVVQFINFGVPFEITGIPVERNSIDVCFNASTGLMEGWLVYVQAAGQKWRRVSNYNFTLGLMAQW